MNFLHTNPELAAASLCDQDVEHHITMGLDILYWSCKNDPRPGKVAEWVEQDGLNYHWMGYFVDLLTRRHPAGTKWWSEISSLRRSVPTRLKCLHQTPFPPFKNVHPRNPAITLVSYRSDYVNTRHKYAIWSTSSCPGWFIRLANTLLSPEDKREFLLRVQPVGLSCSEHTGSKRVERKESRDGPVGSITDESGTAFTVWEG